MYKKEAEALFKEMLNIIYFYLNNSTKALSTICGITKSQQILSLFQYTNIPFIMGE